MVGCEREMVVRGMEEFPNGAGVGDGAGRASVAEALIGGRLEAGALVGVARRAERGSRALPYNSRRPYPRPSLPPRVVSHQVQEGFLCSCPFPPHRNATSKFVADSPSPFPIPRSPTAQATRRPPWPTRRISPAPSVFSSLASSSPWFFTVSHSFVRLPLVYSVYHSLTCRRNLHLLHALPPG